MLLIRVESLVMLLVMYTFELSSILSDLTSSPSCDIDPL